MDGDSFAGTVNDRVGVVRVDGFDDADMTLVTVPIGEYNDTPWHGPVYLHKHLLFGRSVPVDVGSFNPPESSGLRDAAHAKYPTYEATAITSLCSRRQGIVREVSSLT